MEVSKLGRHHWEMVEWISQSGLWFAASMWEREPVGARRSFSRVLRPSISSMSCGR